MLKALKERKKERKKSNKIQESSEFKKSVSLKRSWREKHGWCGGPAAAADNLHPAGADVPSQAPAFIFRRAADSRQPGVPTGFVTCGVHTEAE